MPQPKKSSRNKYLFISALMLVLLGAGIVFAKNAKALFDPVSVVANFTAADLKETDGRTNILILGSDHRDTLANTGVLTDTMMVASIGKTSNDVVLISLPRDLWVTSPQGNHTKVNAIYELEGADSVVKEVSDVLGIPIHYYALINFNIFEETINTLGGVDVNVETAFTDNQYPIEGKENAPEEERYQTIHFDAGIQKMDGPAALKFVRSRHGDNGEGTDFARARRQQKVIMAIKDKMTNLDVLLNPTKLKDLYQSYSKNVDTSLTFADIQAFYLLAKDLKIQSIKSVVLDDRSSAVDGGLLYAPTDTSLYGGAYVLLPKTGDYGQMHAYVQKYLFGSN
ncbi:MAG TPA: LCP family protein [Candidatus Saccharimonadales bacterium]|nr:LCP family protein [Candidatus Saccharimonadales bacterium]